MPSSTRVDRSTPIISNHGEFLPGEARMRPARFFWILIVDAPMLTAAAQTQPASKGGTAPPLQPRPATAAGLPTEQEIDAALRRNLGYDPSVTSQFYAISPSAMPEITDVVLPLTCRNPCH